MLPPPSPHASPQVQPRKQPYFEPVKRTVIDERGACHGKKHPRRNRGHQEAAQCEQRGHADTDRRAGQEEPAGPCRPAVVAFAQQIDAGLRAEDQRREGERLKMRRIQPEETVAFGLTDCLMQVKSFLRKTANLYSVRICSDLSEEPLKENIAICKKYLERMSKIGMTLEIELGVTGGEEDGVDNSGVDNALLYTQPEDVAFAYEELNKISPDFTIAASFGNVHGVYKPGNVKLTPKILG